MIAKLISQERQQLEYLRECLASERRPNFPIALRRRSAEQTARVSVLEARAVALQG
jgi:hypothetical protein